MAGQITLPGIGPVDRRWVYGGVALVAGIVGYAWWQRSRGGPVAEVTAAEAELDPLTGLPVVPQAGGGYTNPNPVQSVIDLTNPDEIRTNVQWSQAVTDRLTLIGSWDSGFIAATIGKYLANQALQPDEQTLIRTAWAYAGKPPEGPAMFVPAPTGGGGTTTPPPATQPPAGNPVFPMIANVRKDWIVAQWIKDLNGMYRAGGLGTFGLTEAKLKSLNPGLSIVGGRFTKDQTVKIQ